MIYILSDLGNSYKVIDNEDMAVETVSKEYFEQVKALGIPYKDIPRNTTLLQQGGGYCLSRT